jgi:hypothetical protein
MTEEELGEPSQKFSNELKFTKNWSEQERRAVLVCSLQSVHPGLQGSLKSHIGSLATPRFEIDLRRVGVIGHVVVDVGEGAGEGEPCSEIAGEGIRANELDFGADQNFSQVSWCEKIV